MEFVITGHGAEVTDKFKNHVEEKLGKVEQFAPRAQRVQVVVSKHNDPARADEAKKIELTVVDKGPVIHAEATGPDQYTALDSASSKLFERLRRASERRLARRREGRRDTTPTPLNLTPEDVNIKPAEEAPQPTVPTKPGEAIERQVGDSPVVVRDKLYDANPMTVEDALYQMELVGHPFFLFIDSETNQPCVVYQRHGWTYGLLRLNTHTDAEVPEA
ncbi:ribosome hibernation-promoting factor, HPF/YfiA family [Neoactinobaculum massilliense]|uniref:ribosome hibernation-promoting factor, HPF/YfiA family n=1 Tax=Neoactinobaculum massilliense TaxID=2364794 RepID=UPI000F52E27D|nr:ribosome-associated translation inhibitor RaiA [Neoactinobaculum massilliense]